MERIPERIHPTWHEHLQPLFDNVKMKMIRDELLPSYKFVPDGVDIFNVFKMDINRIKVVILGQDPYANGEAIGYSFAVKETVPIPKSLEVIRQEIITSKVERDSSVNIDSSKWRTLAHWRRQGVFLLNVALTTEWKNSGAHIGQWEWFTRDVIKTIASEVAPIWMLWGAKAQGFEQLIIQGDKQAKETILKAPHPAAGFYNNGVGKVFTGCNHFNICNKMLKEDKETIINW